jgi:ATP-dependent exoDNAse (exonuclease V) alpha subunit
MTTHLTVRLPWHDRGWDGCVCNEPLLNTFCEAQKSIRLKGTLKAEVNHAGTPFTEYSKINSGYRPPCALRAAAYSDSETIVPYESRSKFHLRIPPFSVSVIPFRWTIGKLVKEITDNWEVKTKTKTLGFKRAPRELYLGTKIYLVNNFWNRIEAGKSLIFYYLKDGAPFCENMEKILVGIGVVKEHYRLSQCIVKTDERMRSMSPLYYLGHVVTQDFPNQGFRIPYHEWLRQGRDLKDFNDITFTTAAHHKNSFSYEAGYLSDDQAITVVVKLIRYFERNGENAPDKSEWGRQLQWLRKILDELRHSRHPLPGLAPFFREFRVKKPGSFTEELVKWERGNETSLEGILFNGVKFSKYSGLSRKHEENLESVIRRWGKRKNSQNKVKSDKAELMKRLTRFELSNRQFSKFINLKYLKYLEITGFMPIIHNPYLLVERDVEALKEKAVAFETIDQGMQQSADFRFDDKERIRAFFYSNLAIESDKGPIEHFLPTLLENLPGNINHEYIRENLLYFNITADINLDKDPPTVGLKQLLEFQALVNCFVDIHGVKENKRTKDHPFNWLQYLRKDGNSPMTSKLQKASREQAIALDALYKNRISVLMGGAGTGKTTLLKVFLTILEVLHNQNNVPNTVGILTPTGRAGVRIRTLAEGEGVTRKLTSRNVKTIHKFFTDRKERIKKDVEEKDRKEKKEKESMLIPGTLAIKKDLSAIKPYEINNLIIDECSMISMDVMGALFSVIDTRRLKRLIFVGDPNQLEPIGPGKPFEEIIENLTGQQERDGRKRIAKLTQCLRTVTHSDGQEIESAMLTVANGFCMDSSHTEKMRALDLLQKLEREGSLGDIELVTWNNAEELFPKIDEALKNTFQIDPGNLSKFNESLGIKHEKQKWEKFRDWDKRGAENWQIICPTRIRYCGTEYINRYIQHKFRGETIRYGYDYERKEFPRPFGRFELVYRDKVIQTINCDLTMPYQKIRAVPQKMKGSLHYVSNGEIGLVVSTKAHWLDVIFSSQPDIRYRYPRDQVFEYLELGYAITVHKAQGSEFDTVFFVVPKDVGKMLTHKLIYTGLTRAKEKLVLLVEKDLEGLKDMIRG